MWVLNTRWSLFAYSLLAFSLQRAISHMVAKKKLIWYYQTQKFQGVFLVTESECESCPVMSNSLWLCRLYSLWNCPGQNTGVDSLSLLQGTFPTQGLNPGFPHCRQILYQLSYQESLVIKTVLREYYKTLPLFRHFTVHINLIIQQRCNEEMEFWKLVIISEIFKVSWLKDRSLVLMKFLLGCFNFSMMSLYQVSDKIYSMLHICKQTWPDISGDSCNTPIVSTRYGQTFSASS